MSDQQKIEQKMETFIQNINSNNNISEQKKQQLIVQIQQCQQEANGDFEEFEESIVCLSSDDMHIILHPPQPSLPQQQQQQQQHFLNQSDGQYQQNQNDMMRGRQQYPAQNSSQMYSGNQMGGQRPPVHPSQMQQQIPSQFQGQPPPQQGGKPYMGQQQGYNQGGQIMPKQASNQSYPPTVELTPDQRRQCVIQFYHSIIKKRLQGLNKNDVQFVHYQQKFQQLVEKLQNSEDIDQEQLKFLDKQKYVQTQLKMFEDNIKLCEQLRRESLQNKFMNFRNRLNQDIDLFAYYLNDKEFTVNDRKILMCEDLSCTQDMKTLLDFFKYTQLNPVVEKQLENIHQSRTIKGFDSFLKMIKDNKLEILYTTLDQRLAYFKKFYNIITMETQIYFKQLNDPQKVERQQNFEKYINLRINQFLYREHQLFADQNDLQRVEPALINQITQNRDFKHMMGIFDTLYKQSSEFSAYYQKRQQQPPRQPYSSQNNQNQQGLNSSTGPGQGIRQPEVDQRQLQYQRQQQGQGNYNPSQSNNEQYNLQQQQQLNSQNQLNRSQNIQNQSNIQSQTPQGQPQQSQYGSQGTIQHQRNMSEQSFKSEEDSKRNPISSQQQSTQQQQSQGSQPKIAPPQAQEETPQGIPPQVKQESNYQPPLSQQKQMSTPNTYQMSKTKAKKLLSDDHITKRLQSLCEENKVECPSANDIQNIIAYLNDVFRIYMKNLIERLLQSSIVENIDNEFRLFCSDKLEAHLVPFRGQSIERFLLNKQDTQGIRDMTFLKYYIVQSENKNIRRSILERSDEEIEQACYDSITKNSLFDKSIMKFDLDRTQRKGCAASEEIRNNIQKIPPQKSKNAKKDLKQESMPQAISLATTNCQRQKITLKNIQLYLEADPIYRKSAILLKTYLY